MNHTKQKIKQNNRTASKPVAIKHANSVKTILQPKLKIGAPNGKYEQEADRVADQVMRMPAPIQSSSINNSPISNINNIQRKCAGCVKKDELIQKKSSGITPDVTPTINSNIQSLQGKGKPLSPSERNFFEPRFGSNFSNVRIHTDSHATNTAQSINARAFTHGNNVVFGAGEYSAGSAGSKKLLAHELTHVIQQSDSIQRAEVEDEESFCTSLIDISTDVNTFVNNALTSARTSPGASLISPFLLEVNNLTGGRGPVSPIETFIESLPVSKRFLPSASLSGTRFASLPRASGLTIPEILGLNVFDAHSHGLAHVVGSSAKVSGKCIGSDKLGHFFQQGLEYLGVLNHSTLADAESFGRASEISRSGLGATGVFSNADLAANLSGLSFWRELLLTPSTYSFDVANYVSDDWNEQSNPSFFERSVANEIWATQLTGRWSGAFGLGPSMKSVTVDLSATNTGNISGRFEYDLTGSTSITGVLSGTIRYLTQTVSGTRGSTGILGGSGSYSATPVSGIEIEFNWVSGSNRGKGLWGSRGEQTLDGTYGFNHSSTNGGAFNIVSN